MEKIKKGKLAAMALVMILASCGVDFERSKNGALDGYWHLVSIDTLATGATGDYSKQRIFWSVEHKLLQVKDVDKGGCFLFRFHQTSDSVVLYSPYRTKGHENDGGTGGDELLTDPAPLAHFGVNALEESYEKEALDSRKLILRSKTLRLKFRKF